MPTRILPWSRKIYPIQCYNSARRDQFTPPFLRPYQNRGGIIPIPLFGLKQRHNPLNHFQFFIQYRLKGYLINLPGSFKRLLKSDSLSFRSRHYWSALITFSKTSGCLFKLMFIFT
jgi:hypothetical protein